MIQAARHGADGPNASDNNTGTNNGSLVINFNGQTITVNGHFTGTNAQTGVERINFNDATFERLPARRRTTTSSAGRSDNRDAGGVNLVRFDGQQLHRRREAASTTRSPAAAATT